MNKEPLNKEKQAFTLIELLIVIAIIGLLTVLTVLNFNFVQQRAKLNFATETLVATFREVQTLAKSGKLISETAVEDTDNKKLQCYAIKIVLGDGEGKGVYRGQSNYISIPESQDEKIDSCKKIDDQNWQRDPVFDKTMMIVSDRPDSDSLEFYFKPPFGNVVRSDNDQFKELYTFTISLLSNSDLREIVSLNLNNGNIQREKL